MGLLSLLSLPASPREAAVVLPPSADIARRFFGAKSNPVVPNITDIQPWLYYDRLTAAANTTPANNLLFFTTPMSSTKTKLDTNLKQAGRLPDPKHFLVMSIRFMFGSNMTVADIQAMIRNYYVELEIGDKIFAEGHIDMYPGGGGIDGVATTTATTTTITALNNGIATPSATNNWGSEHGIHILQGQTFQVRLISPSAPTLAASGHGLDIRAILDGNLYREVQ